MTKVLALRGPEDRGAFQFGLLLTLLVHGALAILLATVQSVPDLEAVKFPVSRRLCGDIRCQEKPTPSRRRGPDQVLEDLGIIEAAVVPRLGLAQPNQSLFPRLVKYEQPEKIEEAVNISREPSEKREIPPMDVQAKKAELDKRRKERTLAQILGAPEDDDPRKRPTALDRIVGSPDGSVFGSGLEASSGNIYAGKVALAIRERFVVPPFLSASELRRLRMRIRVTRMNESGQILEFEVLQQSGNNAFDSAALNAIQQFMPKAGGNARLPAPDSATLQVVNTRGMIVDLDGALFK